MATDIEAVEVTLLVVVAEARVEVTAEAGAVAGAQVQEEMYQQRMMQTGATYQTY